MSNVLSILAKYSICTLNISISNTPEDAKERPERIKRFSRWALPDDVRTAGDTLLHGVDFRLICM